VFLSRDQGMPRDCAINFDHIQTVSKGKVGSLITTLSPEKLEQVRQAILFALDL
jgi:mRNA interferase MazF